MATQRQKAGSWGGLVAVAVVVAFIIMPELLGVAVVGAVIWGIFHANSRFNAGQNPELMKTGRRGVVEVIQVTRSQVGSRTHKGPWEYTWTIVLMAHPPGAAAFRVVTYRKIAQQQSGPVRGQQFPAWFDPANPHKFHVEWRSATASAPEPQPRPQPRPRPEPAAPARQVRPAAQPDFPFEVAEQLPPLAEADAGFGFDFAGRGIDGRARVEDLALLEDGSTEMALTVTPRGRPAYRTIVTTYVPHDRRSQVGKGRSLRVLVDPATPGRLMIVS